MCGELFCDCTKMLIRKKKDFGEEMDLNIGKIWKKDFFFMLVENFYILLNSMLFYLFFSPKKQNKTMDIVHMWYEVTM